jgi:ankyrin repeat protein
LKIDFDWEGRVFSINDTLYLHVSRFIIGLFILTVGILFLLFFSDSFNTLINRLINFDFFSLVISIMKILPGLIFLISGLRWIIKSIFYTSGSLNVYNLFLLADKSDIKEFIAFMEKTNWIFINFSDYMGSSVLHYAVERENYNMIEEILLHDVNLSLYDRDGWTPLHLAIWKENFVIVKMLLEDGADPLKQKATDEIVTLTETNVKNRYEVSCRPAEKPLTSVDVAKYLSNEDMLEFLYKYID